MSTKLWIVGKTLDESTSAWEFQGVFDTEMEAIVAARADEYFIGPATLNESLPHESDSWPGAYYPRLERSPDAPNDPDPGA